MKIYTSYFGIISKLPANIKPISIVRIKPKWGGKITNYKDLAPSYGLLKLVANEGKWTELFFKELAGKDPHKIFKELEELADNKDIALLCYEKTGDFCHRHLVAEWLEHSLGIKIEEFVPPKINQMKFDLGHGPQKY